MTKNLKIIVILLLSACSLNPSSSLWTKHKDIKYEESLIIRDLGSKTFGCYVEIHKAELLATLKSNKGLRVFASV